MEKMPMSGSGQEKMTKEERVKNVLAGLKNFAKGIALPGALGLILAGAGNIDGNFSGLTPENVVAGGATAFTVLLSMLPQFMDNKLESMLVGGNFPEGLRKIISAITGKELA